MNLLKMRPRILLLISILSIYTSCNSQTKNTEIFSETTLQKGATVSEIDKSIWVIYQDNKNQYWFGRNGNGVYCYDGNMLKQFSKKNGLCSNQIRGIQEDKLGNLYFDTPQGVSKFDGIHFTTLLPIQSSKNQWKLQTNDLWFKGNGDILGAYRYDGDSLYLLQFSDFNSTKFNSGYSVYSIYKDHQNTIWLGTLSEGVCRFDGGSLQWIYEKELSVLDDGRVPAVRSITEDKDGYFWFSNVIHKYKVQAKHSKIIDTIQYEKHNGIDMELQDVKMVLPYFTSSVFDNDDGALWMTNYNEGVWKFNGESLLQYQIKDGETNVLIVSIYKDHSGILWLGTDNAGVYKFNGKKFEKFTL